MLMPASRSVRSVGHDLVLGHRRPDRAAREDRHAVDRQRQRVAVGVELRPGESARKPVAPSATRCAPPSSTKRDVVQRRRAVRVRPPALDVGAPAPRRARARRARRAAARAPRPTNASTCAGRIAAAQPRRDRQDAVVALDARAQRRRPRPRRRARRTSHTGRHGPTIGGPGAKPGARPRIAVRTKRSAPPFSTTLVRQRWRGRCGCSASTALSARQRISRSLPSSRSSAPTSTACAANIDDALGDHDAVEHDLEDRRDPVEGAARPPRPRPAAPPSKRSVNVTAASSASGPSATKPSSRANLQAVLLRPARHPARRSPAPTRRRGSR